MELEVYKKKLQETRSIQFLCSSKQLGKKISYTGFEKKYGQSHLPHALEHWLYVLV